MKRVSAISAMFVLVVVLTSTVWARGPHGGGRGMGMQQATPEQRAQFLDETASLRESMNQKQNELQALLADPNSDAAQVGTLHKEIFQLRQQILDKAQAIGIGCPYGAGGTGGCMGYGCQGTGRGVRALSQ